MSAFPFSNADLMAETRRRTTRRRFTTKRKRPKVSKSVKKYVANQLVKDKEIERLDFNLTQDCPQEGVITGPYNQPADAIRDGAQYQELSIMFKGKAEPPTNLQDSLRMIVFEWKTDNALDSPQPDEIMESTTTAFAPYGALVHNAQKRKKFRVLWDRLWSVSDLLSYQDHLFQANIDLKKKRMYSPAAVTITGKNRIYVLTLGTRLAAAANGFITAVISTRWVDNVGMD